MKVRFIMICDVGMSDPSALFYFSSSLGFFDGDDLLLLLLHIQRYLNYADDSRVVSFDILHVKF